MFYLNGVINSFHSSKHHNAQATYCSAPERRAELIRSPPTLHSSGYCLSVWGNSSLIKPCRDTWTRCVAAERYRLITQGVDRREETHPAPPPPSPFSSPSSLFPSAHLFDLTWLSFHTSWEWKLPFSTTLRSPGMREACFLIRALSKTLGGLGPCWGRHIDNRPMIFSELWYHSLTPQADAQTEILPQWKDNELSWSSGFSQKTSCMPRLCQSDTTRGYPAFQRKKCESHLGCLCLPYASTPFIIATHIVCNWTSWHSLISSSSLIHNIIFTASKLKLPVPPATTDALNKKPQMWQ